MKRYNIINNSLGWLSFLIAALTYLLTIEPTISFWDCPEFILQGAKLEIGHPPGNPIFMLAARFCITLTGGNLENAAVVVNSMSALLSAGTILLLFWSITHLIKRLLVPDTQQAPDAWQMLLIFGGGLCGALAYTWSDTFWFSAVEGEVYAFSSFCTALVVWLMFKWENRADRPHSDRYLILIAYIIGVSIAVHLLNLLCIPALGLVYYYRKTKNADAKGSLIALGISCILVALILYGLVPGFIKVAQWFELAAVNGMGMSYNTGVLIYAILLVGVLVGALVVLDRARNAMLMKIMFLISVALSGILFIGSSTLVAVILFGAVAVYVLFFCRPIPTRFFTLCTLSILVIFTGYSSYALLLIRSTAATPMNQNAPDNVFDLSGYLNREQYGSAPLLYGPTIADEIIEISDGAGTTYVLIDEDGIPVTQPFNGIQYDNDGTALNMKKRYAKTAKADPSEPDRYVQQEISDGYDFLPEVKKLFPRIYETLDPINARRYKDWTDYKSPLEDIPADVRAEWVRNIAVYPGTDEPIYNDKLGGYYVNSDIVLPYLDMAQSIDLTKGHTGAYTSLVVPTSQKDNLQYFLNYQLNFMYWRYFMWNFAGRQNDIPGNGEPHLGNWISGFSAIDNARLGDQSLLPDEFGSGNKAHNVYYMLPLLLGVIGLLWQALARHASGEGRGIEQFWVVFFLFFMTGMAIVLYLNQTAGQPRERDYAFAGSFYAFAMWIGMGVPAIAVMLRKLLKRFKVDSKGAHWAVAAAACAIGLAVPVQMVSQTWDDHDRSGRFTARDYGMNYLSSVDENGVIFVYGDNDTFPLWYLQEVEGYRTDVKIVNLSYLSTDWYVLSLMRPTYDSKPLPMFGKPKHFGLDERPRISIGPADSIPVTAQVAYTDFYAHPGDLFRNANYYVPLDSLHLAQMFDIKPGQVNYTLMSEGRLTADGAMPERFPSFLTPGSTLYQNQFIKQEVVAKSATDGFNRPVYFACTVPGEYYAAMNSYLKSTGMARQVTPFNGSQSPVVDKAYENVLSKFRWGGLEKEDSDRIYVDETVARIITSLRFSLLGISDDLLRSASLPASEFAVKYAHEHNETVPATRADMARKMLQTLEKNVPSRAMPYEGTVIQSLLRQYLLLYALTGNRADLDHVQQLIDSELPRHGQRARYAMSLDKYNFNHLGAEFLNDLLVLASLMNAQNEIDFLLAHPNLDAEERETVNSIFAGLNENISPAYVVLGATGLDLLGENMNMQYYPELDSYKTVIVEGFGFDPSVNARKMATKAGVDYDAWRSLVFSLANRM
ncbi:MAG: DUF2723 domain-containing protein [Muribaculaceae bacterium]|nr:DUF2723 domain-containing protein [Muribaculaceae bacterium]